MNRDEIPMLLEKIQSQLQQVTSHSQGGLELQACAREGWWIVDTNDISERSQGFRVWYQPNQFQFHLARQSDQIVLIGDFIDASKPARYRMPDMEWFDLIRDESDPHKMFPVRPVMISDHQHMHLLDWMNSKLGHALAA